MSSLSLKTANYQTNQETWALIFLGLFARTFPIQLRLVFKIPQCLFCDYNKK